MNHVETARQLIEHGAYLQASASPPLSQVDLVLSMTPQHRLVVGVPPDALNQHRYGLVDKSSKLDWCGTEVLPLHLPSLLFYFILLLCSVLSASSLKYRSLSFVRSAEKFFFYITPNIRPGTFTTLLDVDYEAWMVHSDGEQTLSRIPGRLIYGWYYFSLCSRNMYTCARRRATRTWS